MVHGTFKKIFQKNHHILKGKKKGYEIKGHARIVKDFGIHIFLIFLLLKEIAIF
jgi:hypothetical protein